MIGQRDNTYDVIKGIGIILVLLGHVWQWNGTLIESFICSFHMPLFFVVAGCFTKSYDEAKGNVQGTILHYIRRLYVPFLVSTLLMVLWFVFKTINNPKYANDIITTLISALWGSVTILETPFGNVGVGALWFLMALLSAKIFFLFVSKWGKWTGLICLIVSPLAVYIYSFKLLIPWCMLHGIAALPFIYAGWWWRRHERAVPLWVCILLMICWIVAILFSNLEMVYLSFGCYPLDILGAIGGTRVVFCFSKWISSHSTTVGRVLAVIGLYSLAIYCWHSIDITASIFRQLLRLVRLPESAVVAEYILRYTATFAAAYLSIKLPILKKVYA